MENFEETISRLKFIGYVQNDEKINVNHLVRQSNNLYTKFSRSFVYPDNRENALVFIKDVITQTFEIIDSYISHENFTICKITITDLIKAKHGISNLKYTYGKETKFGCDLEVIIEQISLKIDNLRTLYPNLFDQTDNKL